MIRVGQWYTFKCDDDKQLFIKEALLKFSETLEHYSDKSLAEFLTKEALRVTPHGHHIGFRTNVDSRYMSTIIYEVEGEDIMITNTNFEQLTDKLVAKYFHEDAAAIEAKTTTEINTILENSDIAKSLIKTRELFKKRNINFDLIVTEDMLSEDDKQKIEIIKQANAEFIQKLFDKAYECCRLLTKANDVCSYQTILNAYGYIRQGN